jgi:hypothetical protein
VPQAARLLGISERAIRKRIAAGSLAAERDGPRWWVRLDGAEPGTAERGTEAAPPEPDPAPALVEQLRSEVAYLRAELTATREQLTEERRRADTLIASLMGRLPELAPVAVEPSAISSGPTTPATPEARPWWRRIWSGLVL